MREHPRFRLTRQASLALLVSAAFAGAAVAAPAARVDFAIGGVSATGADGKQRPIARGAVVESGETVTTAANGRAQLRFSDGGYTSLQPDTQFRIDDYRYDGVTEGLEKGFFSLLKGGLRTVTGAIGRNNKSTYQVTTATATIGIRGTEYLAEVTNSVQLSVGGGTAELRTQEPTPRVFLIREGVSVFLANPAAPLQFIETGLFLPPRAAENQAKRGGQPQAAPGQSDSQQDTSPTVAPPPPVIFTGNEPRGGGSFGLPAGSGYALAFSIGGEGGFCQFGCAAGNSATCGQPIVTHNSGGGLTWTQGSAFSGDFIGPGPVVFERGTLQSQGGSIGGVMAWRLLNNGSAATFTSSESSFLQLGPNEGFHAILFIPTPNMPTTGTATYTMIPGGPTTPTFSNNMGGGGFTPGGMVTSATLNANFGPSPTVSGNALLSFPGGNNYNMGFSGNINGAGFVANGSVFRTAGTGSACASSCGAQLGGGFAGAPSGSPLAPPYAGAVYKINAPGFGVNGLIPFQR